MLKKEKMSYSIGEYAFCSNLNLDNLKTQTVECDGQCSMEEIDATRLALKNTDYPDAVLANYEGRVSCANFGAEYDITAGSLFLGRNIKLSEDVEAESIHLKTDGYPDARIGNWHGRVDVENLGAANNLVANNAFVGKDAYLSGVIRLSDAEISISGSDLVISKNFDVPLFNLQYAGISNLFQSDSRGSFAVMYDDSNGQPDLSVYQIKDSVQFLKKTAVGTGSVGLQNVSEQFMVSNNFRIDGIDNQSHHIILSFLVADYVSQGYNTSVPLQNDHAQHAFLVAGDWFLRRTNVRKLDMGGRNDSLTNATWTKQTIP